MVKCRGVYTFFSSIEVRRTGFCTTVIYFLLTNQTIPDKTVQYKYCSHLKKNNYISVLFCFFDAMVSLFLSLKQMSLVKVNGKCNQAAKKTPHLIDSSSTEGSLSNFWVCFLVQSCADEVSSFHHGTKIYSLKKRGKM